VGGVGNEVFGQVERPVCGSLIRKVEYLEDSLKLILFLQTFLMLRHPNSSIFIFHNGSVCGIFAQVLYLGLNIKIKLAWNFDTIVNALSEVKTING
jgi:hypothetical protein